jgi:hypothetical protein
MASLTIKGQPEWRENVPSELLPVAEDLLNYLLQVPVMIPTACPWCERREFIKRDPRLYECHHCKRRFTPWTGTPFANCRHQESWATYGMLRLSGLMPLQAGRRSGLSHGAHEYRESVIESLIIERWPALLNCWRGFTGNQKPKPLRTAPFASKEEAEAHHNHEYVQCLECGKLYSSVGIHIRTHGMTPREYREKWQIMRKIPISGFSKRRIHSASVKNQIAIGNLDPLELAAAMHDANAKNGRKKPFGTKYIAEMHANRLREKRLWEQSPAIKTHDDGLRQQAVIRMKARKESGEKVKDIAAEFGVRYQTLYAWLKKYG